MMKAATEKGRVYTVKKYFRVIIILAILLATVGLAQNGVAWAQPVTKNDPSVEAQGDLLMPPPQDDNHHGTVHTPHDKIKVCKKGNYSVGGVSTLKVKRLARHYCVRASLRHRNETWGNIPAGAGTILADITLFQVIYKDHSVGHLPEEAGHVELCYAVPPGKNAKLYYLDKKNVWKPMETTVKKGVACARVRASGYYALIGK